MPTTTAPLAKAPAIPLPLPRSSRAARLPRETTAPGPSLTSEQLSALLWNGFGLGRHGSGGRAAWSARSARPVETYLCAPDGCYRYEPHDHVLLPVSGQDARRLALAHPSEPLPALAMVYVTRREDEGPDEETGRLQAADPGAIAASVEASCASLGLPSQRESSFDARLARLLGIAAPRRVALTQSIACAPRAH